MTFYRAERGPVELPARRSSGLSFSKTPAYWRVVSVVPDSPANTAGVQGGDLFTGEDDQVHLWRQVLKQKGECVVYWFGINNVIIV